MKGKIAHVFKILSVVAACFLMVTVLFSGCNASEEWVRKTIEENYYRFDGDYSSVSDMRGLSINQMVARLDKYSAYYTRKQYEAVNSSNAGNKSGIGISYSFTEGQGVVVRSVVGNSPAERAGIKAGDVFTSAISGGKTVQFTSLDSFSSFVSARATGENVTYNLKSGGSATFAKEEYTASYASMYMKDCAYTFSYDGTKRTLVSDEEGGVSKLPDGTAYIYLSQFYGNAADEIAELIGKFNERECTSLILDLRDNGGGYVDLMARIGGRFTSSLNLAENAVAMKAVYKNGQQKFTYCYNYADNLVPEGTDVYVMANHNTASASEALIGVLVSYHIVDYPNIFLSDYRTVSGYANSQPKSYGKGIMQSTFRYEITGEALKLTVAGIYWENGVTIHDRGLTVADGCSTAVGKDDIVNVGYDDEIEAVIAKINFDRNTKN